MNKDSIDAIYGILQQKNITNEYCRKALLCILGAAKQVSELSLSDIFGDRQVSEKIVLSQNPNDLYDYRITRIEFDNFRYFYNVNQKSKKYFGLDFTHNGKPCSLFLVGGNGTGKSTIFAALERYYTGTSSHALAAHVLQNDNRYQTYGFGQIGTAEMGYRVSSMRSSNISEKDETSSKTNISTASFCSDYDMQKIEGSGGDLYNYVLEQLGYGDLVQLRERLIQLVENMHTRIDISMNELSSEEWNEVIEAFINMDAETDTDSYKKFCNEEAIRDSIAQLEMHSEFSDRWNVLHDAFMSPDLDNMFEQDHGHDDYHSIPRLALLYKELCGWLDKRQSGTPVVEVLDSMFSCKRIVFEKERKRSEMPISEENRKEVLNTLLGLIKEKCDSIVQNTLFGTEEDGQNFVEVVMQRFSPNNEKYKFGYDTGSLRLKITVETPGGKFEAMPQEYLNTFRFKLFCLTLKMAVAFGKMKESKTLAPIVIDDVLDASDFENTIKLEQFVYRVYKTYDEKMGEFKKPLQLILLTHDDMVQEAFRKGLSLRISECERSSKPSYYDEDMFLCGRLFDKDECALLVKESDDKQFVNLYLEN